MHRGDGVSPVTIQREGFGTPPPNIMTSFIPTPRSKFSGFLYFPLYHAKIKSLAISVREVQHEKFSFHTCEEIYHGTYYQERGTVNHRPMADVVSRMRLI